MRSKQTHGDCANDVWAGAPQVAAESGMMDCHKFIIAEATASFSLCAKALTSETLANYLARWKATNTHWQKAAGGDQYWESANYIKSQAQLGQSHRFSLFLI